MAVPRPVNHHRSPWIGTGILIGLTILLLALLGYMKLAPDKSASERRSSAELARQMDAGQAKADARRAEAETARRKLL